MMMIAWALPFACLLAHMKYHLVLYNRHTFYKRRKMNYKHLAGCFAMKLVSMIIVMMVMSRRDIYEMTANGQNEMNCERERVGVFISMVHKSMPWSRVQGWKYCTRQCRKRYQFSFICDRFDDFASGYSFSIHRTHTHTLTLSSIVNATSGPTHIHTHQLN